LVSVRIHTRSTTLALAACLAVLAAGCAGGADTGVSDQDAGAPPDADAPDGFTACDPPALTYANFGQAFMTGYCNGCHFFDQSAAQSSGGALASLVTSGAMPRGTHLPTTVERMEFAAWIACGAP
jgi:hypothetical protein